LNTSRWQTLRAQVRRRDGNRCVVCGATERLSVHHVVAAVDGGRDTLDNLVTLCVTHHRRADAARRSRPADGEMRADPSRFLDDPRYQDDPSRNLYWGPPDETTGKPRRWSRPWFNWRSECEKSL
jgi:hypothetical protein